MTNKASVKTLEKFKKEYQKLLAKYSEVQVWPDRDGDLHASIGKDRTYLPSYAPRTATAKQA